MTDSSDHFDLNSESRGPDKPDGKILHDLIVNAPVAIALFDGPKHVCRFANPLFQKIFFGSKTGLNSYATDSFANPETQRLIESFDAVFSNNISTDIAALRIVYDQDDLENHADFDISIQPVTDDEGKAIGVSVYAQTAIQSSGINSELELKKALDEADKQKRLYEAVTNNTPDLAYVFDLNYRFTYANKALLTMWGLSWERAIGKGLRENGYEEWHALMHEREIDEVVATKKSIRGTVSFPHAELGERVYDYIFSPIFNESGNVEAIAGSTRDITELTRAVSAMEESEGRYRILSETLDQQIQDRTRELQRSNDDLQQFAHVASHDLKEPVRKVKVFAGRLEKELDGKVDAASKKYIEKIHSAADRMNSMIEGVLAFSTINASTQNPETVDLNEVIKSVQTDLEVVLQKTHAEIYYDSLPTLEGASVLLYQLFYNLTNNSIKFSRAGVPTKINIDAELIAGHDQQFVSIVFRDNGIGFDESESTHIFDTFTRLNSKDKYEGTGLGLSLCKKIVERHGGTITAHGKVDEGATFVIVLPLLQDQASV